jgi:hypothetical protein
MHDNRIASPRISYTLTTTASSAYFVREPFRNCIMLYNQTPPVKPKPNYSCLTYLQDDTTPPGLPLSIKLYASYLHPHLPTRSPPPHP